MSQLLRAEFTKEQLSALWAELQARLGCCQLKGPADPHWSRAGLDGWLHSTERPGLCLSVLQIPGRAEPGAVSCDPPSWLLGALGNPWHSFCARIPRPYSSPLLRHLSWRILWRPLWPTAVFRLSSTRITPELALIPAFGGRFCSGHAQHCCISVPAGEPASPYTSLEFAISTSLAFPHSYCRIWVTCWFCCAPLQNPQRQGCFGGSF